MPARTITDAMSARMVALRAEGKSLSVISKAVETEFGAIKSASTIRRHLLALTARGTTAATPAPQSAPSAGPPSELDDLHANADRLRSALATAVYARDIASLSAELRKTRQAIREATQAASSGAAEVSQAAKSLRDHLLTFANADSVSPRNPSVGDVQGGSTEEPRTGTGG